MDTRDFRFLELDLIHEFRLKWARCYLKDFDIQQMIESKLSPKSSMRPLVGFKMNVSANPGFKKVFFSVRCSQEDCDTAALLSVEIANSKSDIEIKDALPSLVDRLERQEKSFHSMDCRIKDMMKKGIFED